MWSCTSWMVLTSWFCTILTQVGHRTILGLWAIHIPSLTRGMNHISGSMCQLSLGRILTTVLSLVCIIDKSSDTHPIVTLNMVTLTFHRVHTTYKVFFQSIYAMIFTNYQDDCLAMPMGLSDWYLLLPPIDVAMLYFLRSGLRTNR